MKAAVLAGGAGTRLSPVTHYVPKCMIPVGGHPFLNYVIKYLKSHDVKDIILLVSNEDYSIFHSYFDDGDRYGVKISYSTAPRIGTAGAIKAARKYLNSSFIVYYGDVFTDMDLTKMINFHRRKKSMCTVALSRRLQIEYGVGKIKKGGKLSYFEEKPVVKDYPVSMGIFILKPAAIEYCEPNTDLSSDVIPKLMKKRFPVYGYITDHRHYDIGSFKRLEEIRGILKERGPES